MKILLIILYSSLALGHGGVDHSKKKIIKKTVKIKESSFIKINKTYLENIKPIFKKSCFDCHSNQVSYPWYYQIPGINYLIDQDIKEAKEHLDFSNDYPFLSHETPIKDLESIKKDIQQGLMPPFQYSIMHSDKKISDKEKDKIIQWVDESLKILNKKTNE